MKITEAQKRAALAKADLYGVRFEGIQARAGGKAPVYTWTDLLYGTTFITHTIRELPDKIIAVRHKFSNPIKNTATKKALKLSKKFWGYDPRKLKKINIIWPKALVNIGSAAQINYVSDKHDGQVREYYHEFINPANVYVGEAPQKDGSNLIIIHGNFKIKTDGIVG